MARSMAQTFVLTSGQAEFMYVGNRFTCQVLKQENDIFI